MGELTELSENDEIGLTDVLLLLRLLSVRVGSQA